MVNSALQDVNKLETIKMTKLNIKNYKVITKISTLFIVTLVKTKA